MLNFLTYFILFFYFTLNNDAFGHNGMVIVANKYITKGDILTKDNIDLAKTTTKRNANSFSDDINKFLGKISKVNIAANSPINLRYLHSNALIKKGDTINVEYKIKNINLILKGIALVAGDKGEHIKIKNTMSGKEIFGIVIDNNNALFSQN
ncbi:MAG: flagellar basal body P-ring formation chaperone FlgA [Anaplasmataceae bacterium]|nr:flagellar basal body P-ring formation chaperone FlgA [Anaplasmataceae bacterium]